jgi:amino acid adenylation domain-containing protein
VTTFDCPPLLAGFLQSSERMGDRTALEVDGRALSYRDLRHRAASLAATLQSTDTAPGPQLTAIFAGRSETAYAGVLAALMRGHGYVPLQPLHPSERTRDMLERAGCGAVIVDAASTGRLDGLLQGLTRSLVLLLPDTAEGDAARIAARWPHHIVVSAADLVPAAMLRLAPRQADALAYLLFTSGSTGRPKGVMVTQRNVRTFVDAIVDRYDIGPADRLSQMFDLTFDPSAFDLFAAWERGACVCCPSERDRMTPTRFIRDRRLTCWFSVPSVGVLARRLGLLKPGVLPSLRLSLFCGEPLPVDLATAWAESAPASIVENLYGPTEATISCTVYRWDPRSSPAEAVHGTVPIGSPLPGTRVMVVDEDLREVAPGAAGELLIAGPQVSAGYWRDPQKTAAAFVVPPGRDEVHYRTGDRVLRSREDGPLCFLGRTDSQIKVMGHRVELGEVEAVLRDVCDTDEVVAVGWPRTATGASGIVAFASSLTVDPEIALEVARRRLPAVMVPRQLRVLAELPLNPNGKIDRNALLQSLEESRVPVR